MKFSIATPVYNGMPALRRCIGSVRGQLRPSAAQISDIGDQRSQINNQTEVPLTSDICPPTSTGCESQIHVQHIVQDGGSSDGSVEFLEKFDAEINGQGPEIRGQESVVSTDLRLPVSDLCPAYTFSYVSERDAGMYDAINKAWERGLGPPVNREPLAVEGEKSATSNIPQLTTHNNHETIVSWLNSDEQYLPGTLQKVAEYFEAHPDVDAVFGNTIITDANGAPYAARREIPLRKSYVANGFLYALSCSTFYRRKLWDSGLLKLDTQYRYSADADLVLRLLSEGVRFGHVDDFFALFGVEDGQNLSFRPEMKVEGDAIKRKYGALRWAAARRMVLACRYAERLLRGCYRPVPVEYAYALDEIPTCKVFQHPKLGFRFTYAGFSKEQDSK